MINRAVLYVDLFSSCMDFLLFSGSGSADLWVCVYMCVCMRKVSGPMSATFGLFSGRACRNDTALGFALLCNPPTSLKHHLSFNTTLCINTSVCTCTHGCLCGTHKLTCPLPFPCILINKMQSEETFRYKHVYSQAQRDALDFHLPGGRGSTDSFLFLMRVLCVCLKMGFSPITLLSF